MNTPIRPPPKVLLIHDGADVEPHVKHLTGADLDVSKAHGKDAVTVAIGFQPDIIILDFRCDGEIMARLKATRRRKGSRSSRWRNCPMADASR